MITDYHNFYWYGHFYPQAAEIKTNDLVGILNKVIKSYDKLSIKYNIEKIKAIGDSYFAIRQLGKDSILSVIDLISLLK